VNELCELSEIETKVPKSNLRANFLFEDKPGNGQSLKIHEKTSHAPASPHLQNLVLLQGQSGCSTPSQIHGFSMGCV
jgi:hypothetical protein